MERRRFCKLAPFLDEQSQNPINPLPKPSKAQLAFQDLELGLFIHYGMITYTRYSDPGRHSPDKFNPSALDTDNWMEVAKAMGAKFAVLTVRHQEGFCLWPTRSTEYSIKNSPYKNGKGDVVREFVESCHRYGIKPCFYHCSLMDAHHLFQPSDPYEWHKEWFETTNRRLSEPGAFERFLSIQKQQIRELLTEYGEITYLWLDHITETQGILIPELIERFWCEIVAEARSLQPNCLLLKCDVFLTRDKEAKTGVHGGRAAYPLWYACRREDTPEGLQDPIPDPINGDQYIVWESNTIFSGDWFWNGDYVKPVEEMLEHYYLTIGRGSTFLPNFAPAPDGKMTDKALRYAKAFGDKIKSIYENPIATLENAGESFEIALYNEPFTHIEIMEDLREGQKIAGYKIEILKNGIWERLAEGESIGHKRLHRFEPISAEAVRFSITKSFWEKPRIRKFTIYK